MSTSWKRCFYCFVFFFSFTIVPIPARSEVPQLTGIELAQPPIDLEMVHRLWVVLKKETNAPSSLPYPPIVLDWEVPKIAMMGFQYPTKEYPDNRLQISLAPRTLDLMKDQEILFGIGHELTHYLFLLRNNGWDPNKKTYEPGKPQHCDPEFQRLMRMIIQKIWDTYHDDATRNRLNSEPRRSCTAHPDQ